MLIPGYCVTDLPLHHGFCGFITHHDVGNKNKFNRIVKKKQFSIPNSAERDAGIEKSGECLAC